MRYISIPSFQVLLSILFNFLYGILSNLSNPFAKINELWIFLPFPFTVLFFGPLSSYSLCHGVTSSTFLQYTVKNLQFALTIEPDNTKIQRKLSWAQNQRQKGHPTIPSTIEEELETNPFMWADLPEVQVQLPPYYWIIKKKKRFPIH